jgi:hypothetical protein
MAPNLLDDPSSSVVGTSTAAPVSSHALVQTLQVAPASLPAPSIAGASTWSSLPPAYSLAQQPQETIASGICDGQPTFDVMTRQTAAGYRAACPLHGGLAGGGAEGKDLTPPARRVLHAQQMLCGMRAAGALISMPPAGELPPVSSYPPDVARDAQGIDVGHGLFCCPPPADRVGLEVSPGASPTVPAASAALRGQHVLVLDQDARLCSRPATGVKAADSDDHGEVAAVAGGASCALAVCRGNAGMLAGE